jgi:hypothetical protein
MAERKNKRTRGGVIRKEIFGDGVTSMVHLQMCVTKSSFC